MEDPRKKLKEIKIEEVFSKTIQGHCSEWLEIDQKITKFFTAIVSELDELGILIFKTPELPDSYRQERKFLLQGQIFVSIKKDLCLNILEFSLEYFHLPTEDFSPIFLYMHGYLYGLADRYGFTKLK